MISPVIVQVKAPVVTHVRPLSAVAVYPVTAAPPEVEGAVQATVIDVSPAVIELMVGAPGTVAGTAAADAVDDGPVPALLVAVTAKVYESPLVRPVTMHGLLLATQI